MNRTGTSKRATHPESKCPRSLSERDEGYVRFLASYFFASGHDREDIEQEARLAMLRARPGYERLAARRQVLDLVKVANRRAFVSVENPEEFPTYGDLVEHVARRERLRTFIESARTPDERLVVGRRFRGETIPEKRLQQTLVRYRRRVASCPM